MDNCPIHLGEEVKKAIEKTGAKLIYLSPYSPDFSPIENLWSKLKIILRSIKTTNYQELGKAIEFAFGSALHRQIFLTGLHTAVIVPHLFEKGYKRRQARKSIRQILSNRNHKTLYSNRHKSRP
jgi:hypothetical protein